MKFFVVNEDQLMELTFLERIGERVIVVTEIKKHEITRAPIPVKEPVLYICPVSANCEDTCSHAPVHNHNINCNFTKGTCPKCISFIPQEGE